MMRLARVLVMIAAAFVGAEAFAMQIFVKTLSGKTVTLDVDQVVVAIGVSPNPLVPKSIEGLELGRKNTIAVGDDMQSSRKAIFAGGDIVRGGATVILAMGDGRRAAANMHQQLSAE